MGFPRKNDGIRIYREKSGAHFALLVCNGPGWRGYDAIANVHPGPRPSLCGTSISSSFLDRTWPTRVQWDEMPDEWREAFQEYLSRGEDEPFDPCNPEWRGLWRVGKQPPSAKGPANVPMELDAKECKQCPNLIPRDREDESDFCSEECREEYEFNHEPFIQGKVNSPE